MAAKSVGTAFSLVFVQIGVTALLVGIAAGIVFRSRSDIDPAHPVASARWHRRYMTLSAKALLGLVAMINVGMLGSSLLMAESGLTVAGGDRRAARRGLFYINREDPALWVARRFGVGWTLNFGNPRAAILLAAVVALISLAVTLRFGG